MSIRFPLQTIKSIKDTGTTGSVTANTFILPQDCDSVVVKAYTGATFTGTNPTCQIWLQTTDDGGSTWYDVFSLPIITAAIDKAAALWGTATVLGQKSQGSVIGAATVSTLGSARQGGLPILSRLNRILITYGGTQLTNTGVEIRVMANSQSRAA
jgi:hypothetical protein